MSKAFFFRKLCLCMAVVLVLGSLAGCAGEKRQDKEQAPESGNGFEVSSNSEEFIFSVENYAEQVRDDLIPIQVCRENYEAETEELKQSEYRNIHFDNCTFRPFPDMEDLELLITLDKDTQRLTKEERLEIIENWGKSVGKDIDLDADVEESSNVTVVAQPDRVLWVDGNGITEMDEGKIYEFTGKVLDLSNDEIDPVRDTVESGTLEEIGEKEYPLISGSLTLNEGAELVRDYFRKGTPFPPADGVEYDIIQARVFRLKNVFGYEYLLQRTYHTVPIALKGGSADSAHYRYYENISACGDFHPFAYVVDDTGVSSFGSNNQSQVLHSAAAGNKMIGASQMGKILSEGLASMINVDASEAGLCYFPVWFDDGKNNGEEEIEIFPCWEIKGKNRVKNEDIYLYLDVFTGRILFYLEEPE